MGKRFLSVEADAESTVILFELKICDARCAVACFYFLRRTATIRWLLPSLLLFAFFARVDAQGTVEKISVTVRASTYAQIQQGTDIDYTPHIYQFIDGQNVTFTFRATGYLPVILRVHITADMDKELSVTMKPDPRWKRLGNEDYVQWNLNQFILFTAPYLRAEEHDLIGYDPRSNTRQILTSTPQETQRQELARKYPFLDSSDWNSGPFFYSPSLSPDGKRLLYSRRVLTDKGYRKESIWFADLTTGNQVDTQIFDRDGTMNAVWISNDEAMINVLGSVSLFKRNNQH